MTSSVDNNDDIRCVHNIVTPVLSSELKIIILQRLQKEITSKIGGSVCKRSSSSSDTSKRLGGKKRARDYIEVSNEPSPGKETKSRVDGKVNVSMSISESVVRSRLVVGRSIAMFICTYLQNYSSCSKNICLCIYRDKPMYKST